MFYLGAIVFSLLECISERIILNMNYVSDRSRCLVCNRILKWYEIIPILSYLLLKGRCRSCGSRIPIRLLLVELLGCYVFYISRNHIQLFLILCIVYLIARIDLSTKSIYIVSLVPLFMIDCMQKVTIERVIGAMMITIIMIMMNFVIHNSFGTGDLYLITLLGYYFKQDIVMIMLLATMMGCIVGGCLIFRNPNNRMCKIPFVPFIFAGLVLYATFYDNLLTFITY